MLEIFIISLLLVINGVFSMTEIALVSVKKSRLVQAAQKGNNGAKKALDLLKEPEKFLSTIQIGITLVGIIAGAYGGEAFTEDLKPIIEKSEWLRPYAETLAFSLIVLIITYFSLVIGELVPKSIAMNNAFEISVSMASIMKILSKITYPFVLLLTLSTKLTLKIFMIKDKGEEGVTEDELRYMIDSGSQHGVIEKKEREIMLGVFKLGDKKVTSVMTHRTDIEWLNIRDSQEKIIQKIEASEFSRLPVCDESLDNILGTVLVKDVMILSRDDENFDLMEVVKKPLLIPNVVTALKTLELFQKSKNHLAFVTDEFGGVEGMVTLHDIFETIIGELPELENEENLIVTREDGSLIIDADIRIDEIKRKLSIAEFEGENFYSTLGGFILYKLQRLPVTGEKIIYSGWKFEVIDMDGNRIDKILATMVSD